MCMLELYAADQLRNLVEGSERSRPVRNRQPSVVAGDKCAGNDEKKYPAGKYDRESVQPAIVRCGDGFQNDASSVREICRGSSYSASEQSRLLSLLCPKPYSIKAKTYSPAALKDWSTVLESLGATVTFWSCSPSFS